MKKFIIIFMYNDILYDATVKDLSYPAGKNFRVDFSYGQQTGCIPNLHCIDPIKLKWDSESFADKELCQVAGHAIAMHYKKEYLLQLQ